MGVPPVPEYGQDGGAANVALQTHLARPTWYSCIRR